MVIWYWLIRAVAGYPALLPSCSRCIIDIMLIVLDRKASEMIGTPFSRYVNVRQQSGRGAVW